MSMTPGWRKLMLTLHLCASVGWLGAGAAFLSLCLIGLTTDDGATARSAYLVLRPLCWAVLVPLSVASLVTGVAQSLGTPWGLVRHYWVLTKLLLNLVATAVLLLFANTVGAHLADRAEDPSTSAAELDRLAVESFSHAVLAVLALVIAVVLGVFKPWGRTPFGRRHGAGTT